MKQIIEQRFCLYCNDPLKGRSDKKFCDDQCRNAYNNEIKSIQHKEIGAINKVLARNRKILKTLLNGAGQPVAVKRDELLMQGFHFNYITHSTTNKEGNMICFCYDHGYWPSGNETYLIIGT